MDQDVRRRRQALFLLFLLAGIAMSSWVTRTPAIRDRLDLSTAHMGLVLFGLSFGSMAGISCSGRLVSRFGTRPVIVWGTWLLIAGMAAICWGSALASVPAVTAGLCAFGAGMGVGDVAINVDGTDVERVGGRTTLPALHGCFSLGTVLGAGAGMAATAAGVPVYWHLAAVVLLATVLLLCAVRAVPEGTGRAAPVEAHEAGVGKQRPAVWKDGRLLLIGGIVLAMALAEGAANDWLPLLMVDGHGMDATAGSLVYAGFAAAMTLGRFAGTFFIDRLGRTAVVRASALSGALGLLAVIVSDNAVLAGTAVLLWGLGASLGFPLALSAAGESGPDQTARVSLVAVIGYVAFLVGPPGLGFLGGQVGLRPAMLVVLACVVCAAFLAPAVETRARAEGPAARSVTDAGAPATADEDRAAPAPRTSRGQ
ncbi:MFS transporter [Streptomyces sp. ME02-8801-2C]|uniref:MFS transporter n=1 Tax=Streptomyces sp. ME02-8801-2C TaxID=3028680 RepID=UPI0029B768D0|nr:MFS transporter [Streptomyces sp. ME02-8801-2C]MDX3457645.1 MFS transporter [Streptomyces sp. ME02-8801-2C]